MERAEESENTQNPQYHQERQIDNAGRHEVETTVGHLGGAGTRPRVDREHLSGVAGHDGCRLRKQTDYRAVVGTATMP